jgi:Tfp pilus assembly protein PilX
MSRIGPIRRSVARPARGVTVLVVLMLLVVMLLCGLSLARVTELTTVAAGNEASRQAAVQASEVGVNTAFSAVKALANEDADLGSWYRSTMQATDANGIPQVSFDLGSEVVVGRFSVRYVVERMCDSTPVTDTLRQCLVRQIPQTRSAKAGVEAIDPPNSRQFRVTVRVTEGHGTQTWVQALVART